MAKYKIRKDPPAKKKGFLSALDALVLPEVPVEEKAPPKKREMVVHEAEFLPPEAPKQDGLQVSLESKKALPVLRNEATEATLAAIHRKLKKVPQRICDSCYLAHDCPGYEKGAVCLYNEAFTAYDSRDIVTVLDRMRTIVESNSERYEFSKHAERVSASGQVLPEVTSLSKTLMEQSKQLLELQQDINKLTITAVGSETQKRSEGILSRIFGSSEAPALTPATEVPVVVTEIESSTDEELDQ